MLDADGPALGRPIQRRSGVDHAQTRRVPVEDGGTVTVAVTDQATPSREVTRGLRRESDVVERSRRRSTPAVAVVRPAADALLRRLQELHRVPDEVTVEFGVELSAEAGAFIAAVSTTAQFRVSMTWSRRGASARDVSAASAARG